MRGKKQDGRNSDGTGYRIIKRRFGWKRFFQNRREFVHDISRIGVATAMSVGGRSKGVHCIELFSGCRPPMSGLVRLACGKFTTSHACAIRYDSGTNKAVMK
jgi:hypothetical protein